MWTTCGNVVKNYVDGLCIGQINNSFIKNTKKFSYAHPHVNFMISTVFLNRVRLENTGFGRLFHSFPSPTTKKTENLLYIYLLQTRERSYTQL